MKMESLKITHFFDVIKNEPISEDQHAVSAVEPDLNDVKQEYPYKEELDVPWDERDNDYGMGQENYDVSNNLSHTLGLPLVVVEKLSDDIVNKRIPTVQRKTKLKNAVFGKSMKRGFLQYYQKFCTGCKKREPSGKKTHECKNCDMPWNYECKKCSKKLSSYGGIINHLNVKCIEQGNYYKCFKCNYKSADKYKVNTHLKNVHSTSDSLSRIEKFRSENVQNDVVDAVKLHKCSKCGKQFQKLPPLLRHVQTCGRANYSSNSFVATVNAVQDKCLHHCVKCNQTVKNDGVGSFHLKKCAKCDSKFSFKCKECDKIFHSYSGINQHSKVSHKISKEVFKCPECDYETFFINFLSRHVQRKHFVENHECSKCGRQYNNRAAFKTHFRFCKTEATFQCDYCSRRSKSKSALRVHIFQVHTTGNEVDCPQCGTTLKNNKCLKVHLRYCKKEPHLQCNICSFKTKYKNDLKIHCDNVHCDIQIKIICPNCAKECKNNSSLRSHLKFCGKFLEVPCKYCHRFFKAKCSLTQHIYRVHSKDSNIDIAYNLPYLHCNDCLYKTKFKGDLVKHVTKHQDNNATKCPKCKKCFKNVYYIKHAEYCGREPLRCDLCNFQTLTKECLKSHIGNKHSEGNEIDCSKCGRTCKNNNYLKAHLQRCGTKPHLQCNHCQYKTRYQYVLRRHIEKFHTKKRL